MAAKVSLQRHLFSSYVIAPSFPLDGRTRDTMNDQRMCKVASSSGSFVKFRSYSKNIRQGGRGFSYLPLEVDVGCKIHLPVKPRLDHSDTDLDHLCTLFRSVLSSTRHSTSLISDIWFQLGMYCTQEVVDALCVDPI